MAIPVRKPPSPSDYQDARAVEYFYRDLYDQGKLAGSVVSDLSPIASGGQVTLDITVDGAIPDKGQTVEYGLPAGVWNDNLIVKSARVIAVDTVRLVISNPTGGSIDVASGTYSARVRP